jgi:hypothetical protein
MTLIKTMVTQIPNASTTEVIYPESDGQPMANNTEQFRWIVGEQRDLVRSSKKGAIAKN